MTDDNDDLSAPSTLGGHIRQARENAGISLRGLAAKLQMQQSYIHRLETDYFKQPSPEVLQRVASAIGIKYEDLFALAGYMVPEGLPSFMPYMRAKYEMDERAAQKINAYFQLFRWQHGVSEKTQSSDRRVTILDDDELPEDWPPAEEFINV